MNYFRSCVERRAVLWALTRRSNWPRREAICSPPEYVITRGIGCLLNPSVVIEVLSPSTAGLDENEKLLAYTGIRTIREYLVVSTSSNAATLYWRRSADDTWGVRLFQSLEDHIKFESCGCDLAMSEIYAGLDAAELRVTQVQDC